jgi:hypothetical protein
MSVTPLAFLFTTWWSALIVGAAAASVPIIIHLLNRKRFKVVTWAAMRFLLAAQKQNVRRMRLEQILLLAVRTLLIVLVVLAMASVTGWAEDLWKLVGLQGTGQRGAAHGRTHKIIVVDGSFSMAVRQPKDKETCYERARARAIDIINKSGSGDSYSIILMGGRSSQPLGLPSPNKTNVLGTFEKKLKRQPHGNADVAATLKQVEKLALESARNFQATEIYFLTDLQRSTWLPERSQGGARPRGRETREPKSKRENELQAALQTLQSKALVVFVDVGRDKVDNLAITDLRIREPFVTTGSEVHIQAAVRNYGARGHDRVKGQLFVIPAGQTYREKAFKPLRPLAVDHDEASLERGEQRVLNFRYTFREPGEYAVQVKLGPDELPLDNVRSFVVTVKKNIRVLLVNGKPSREQPSESATRFLERALNPSFKGPAAQGQGLLTRVQPQVVTEAELANLRDADLFSFDCIFYCDVDRPSKTEVRRLKSLLRRGGGVIFTLGPQTADHLERYNLDLYEDAASISGAWWNSLPAKERRKYHFGILPARLLGVQKAPARHYFAFDLGKASFTEPPLRAFDSDNGRLLLQAVRFRHYVRAEVPADLAGAPLLVLQPGAYGSKPEVDASLNLPTHDPAILMWQPVIYKEGKAARRSQTPPAPEAAGRYRGQVGLITTTVNMDWTTWPASFSYLPLMHELLHLAITGRLREQAAVVGDELEEYLAAVGQQAARVHTPDRRTVEESRTQLTEDASVWRWSDTALSGIYRVTFGKDAREHLFAVNVPAVGGGGRGSESDFSKPRCTQQELRKAYAGWRLQVVSDLRQIDRKVKSAEQVEAAPEDAGEDETEAGPDVAYWTMLAVLGLLILEVILAWAFGHYSSAAGTGMRPRSALPAAALVGGITVILFGLLAWMVIHAALTDELPEAVQDTIESTMDRTTAKAGETNTSRLETSAIFLDSDADVWLVGALALTAVMLVVVIYVQEGPTANAGFRVLLAGLRISLILLTVYVFLPQPHLKFVREEWPDLVILIDTSESMGVTDHYQKREVSEAAEQLAAVLKADLRKRLVALRNRLDASTSEAERRSLRARIIDLAARQARLASTAGAPTRLELASTLLTQPDQEWIQALVAKLKMKVYVYHLDATGEVERLGDLNTLDDPDPYRELVEQVKDLKAQARVSPLGAAVDRLLDTHGTATLAAIVVLTDGNTVEEAGTPQAAGKPGPRTKRGLIEAAQAARGLVKKKDRVKKRGHKDEPVEKGVPLFLVGIGDAHDLRDIKLVSLNAPSAVRVRDYIRLSVTLQGHKDTVVPLQLFEKGSDGKEKLLKTTPVKLDASSSSKTVELRHQPEEIGEKTYVVRLDVPRSRDPRRQQRDDYLWLQRKVLVEEARLTHVLYVEGSPRYEYRYLKTLLERESAEDKTNKTIDLKVVLLSADDDFAKEDKSALLDIPVRGDLFKYDVVILGDADPQDPRIKDRLKDLADFVLEKGGGFLMIAGENFSPHAFKDTPLQAVLPIELVQEPAADEVDREEGFRPVLTPEGMNHELFRFTSDDEENKAIWGQLAEIYWWSEGYRAKDAAHVLAVHPTRPALGPVRPEDREKGESKHPLVVYHRVNGWSMFFGFDETWRWRFREYEGRYNQFWKNTVAFLARQRAEQVEMFLEKQTPYVRGQEIKVIVKFPEKGPPPPEVKIRWQRAPTDPTGAVTRPDPPETLKLEKNKGSFAQFEGEIKQTREGKYVIELVTPETANGPAPRAECVVIAPEGEMENLSMNRVEMVKAAAVSRGLTPPAKPEEASGPGFYTLATAHKVLDELPAARRWELDDYRDPYNLWNHWLLFGVVVFLLGSEWILRKVKHLL